MMGHIIGLRQLFRRETAQARDAQRVPSWAKTICQHVRFTVWPLIRPWRLRIPGTDSTIRWTGNVDLVSEFCKIHKCKPYTPPDIAIIFNKILWANWATSVIVTFVGITVMYRKWIKVRSFAFQMVEPKSDDASRRRPPTHFLVLCRRIQSCSLPHNR